MPRISPCRSATFCALAFVIVGSMAFPSAPRAETAQDSASAKALLGDVLEYITELVASSGEGLTAELGGEASAQPIGNRVEMIFPDPSILDQDGSGFHMENVTATVTPQEKHTFQFSVGLPNSVTVSDAEGKPKGAVSWSESAMRGIWRADIETATAFHGALKNVRIIEPSEGGTLEFGRIDSIVLDQELKQSANGWWSGPYTFDVSNIEIAPPGEDEQISLEAVSLSGSFQDFDLAAWQALSEWGSSISIPEEGTEANPFGDSLAAARIFEAMNLGAGNMALKVSNLRFGPPGIDDFSMGGLRLTMSYDNNARPGAYNLGVEWADLEQIDSDLPPAFFTHTGSLKLHLEQFPIRQILTLVLRESDNLDPSGSFENPDAIQLMVMPLINANQTALRLEELVLRSTTAALAASGNISARNNTALGFIGEAHLEITGLDKLIVVAARQAESGEDAPNLLAFLTLAKGLGKPEVGADGDIVYIFDILLPADGTIQINEIPLNLLRDSGTTALPELRPRASSANAEAPRS